MFTLWREGGGKAKVLFSRATAFLACLVDSLSLSLSFPPLQLFFSLFHSVTKDLVGLRFSLNRISSRFSLSLSWKQSSRWPAIIICYSLFVFVFVFYVSFLFILFNRSTHMHTHTYIKNREKSSKTERERGRYASCRFVDRKPDERRIRIRIRSPRKI